MPSDATEKPSPSKPIPYESTVREDGAEAMKRWTRTRLENACRYVGECPRCNHRTEKVIPDKVVVLKFAMDREPPKSDKYVVECDCGQPHPDRPEGAKGCGARWGVEISREGTDQGGAAA